MKFICMYWEHPKMKRKAKTFDCVVYATCSSIRRNIENKMA